MTNHSASDPRRSRTDEERRMLIQVSRIEWQSGSLNAIFIRGLNRVDTISEKQAKRLGRLWRSVFQKEE